MSCPTWEPPPDQLTPLVRLPGADGPRSGRASSFTSEKTGKQSRPQSLHTRTSGYFRALALTPESSGPPQDSWRNKNEKMQMRGRIATLLRSVSMSSLWTDSELRQGFVLLFFFAHDNNPPPHHHPPQREPNGLKALQLCF